MSEKTIRILLIESSIGDARLIREMLADAGQADPDVFDCDIVRAVKLSTGLKRLAKGDIDVVLLDLSLSDSQGLDTFAKVHAQAPKVPVIVLTSPEDKALAVEVVRKGAHDHLTKGQIGSDLLVRCISYAVKCARVETVQQQTEETLRASEQRFRLLYENTPLAYHLLDKDGRLIEVNQAWLDMLGYSRDQAIGRWFGDFLPPQHADSFERNFPHFIATGTIHAESEMVRKDGSHIAVSIDGRTRRDEQGNFREAHCIIHDVTERKRAEKALYEREREFKSLVEHNPDMIARFDRECRHTYVSPAVEEELGIPPQMLVGKTHREAGMADEQADSSEGIIRQVFESGQEMVFETVIPTDREVKYYLTRGVPEFAEDGSVTSALFIHRNITDRKRMEEALHYRAQFEGLITDISTHFINLASDEIDSGISRALQLIGGFADVDRSYIFLFHESGATMDNTHEWCGEGIEPQIQKLKGLPTNAFQWSLKRIRRSEVVHIPRVTDLPAAASAEKEEFQTEGIQSLIMVPIVYGKEALGFLGLDSVRAEREWGEDIIALLRIVGEIFANALERKKAEVALRESEERYRQLFELESDALFLIDNESSRILEANAVASALYGYSHEELLTKRNTDLSAEPEDTKKVTRTTPITDQVVTVPLRFHRKKDGTVFPVEITGRFFDRQGQSVHIAAIRDITERKQAEKALRDSRHMLQTVLDSIPAAVFWKDRDSIYLGGNRTWLEAAGLKSPEEVVGKSDYDLPWEKAQADSFREDDRKVMESGVPKYDIIEPYLRADGTHAWAKTNKVPLRDTEGNVVGILGTYEDITEHKRAEEALRESEHMLAEAQRVAHLGWWEWNVNSDIIRWSEEERRIFGLPPQGPDQTLDDVLKFVHPDDLEKTQENIRKGLAGEAPYEFETRIVRPDGSVRYIDTRAQVYRDDQKEPVRVMGTTMDITERKQAEEEREHLLAQIQEQAQRVQRIIDTVPEGVILLDTDARIVLANPLGHKDLTVLADTLVGGTLTRLGDRPLTEILTSPPQGLWHEITAEGRDFQVIARSVSEATETGPAPGGWVLVIRDVTRQRETERRIQQQERLAAVGQLAAGIAHDFNNIMAVIALYAGMSLQTPDVPKNVCERLEIINQQARHASDLIQQIMDFSRRAVLERGPMDLLAFMKEQIKLLQRTLPESIKIDLDYGKDEYTIRADPTRIQQVIMNLATNARDAMPQGGNLHIILERIRLEEGDSPPVPEMEAGEWVCVQVADTGSGIPDDILPHIFNPFFTTKEPGKGTGLGLAQVYGIIRQHEGHINFKTQTEKGTTFILYLPALSAASKSEPPTAEEEKLPQGKGQTILVVEDDTATRAAIGSSLELLGYQVLEAANGQEALLIFERHADQANQLDRIALVLSDVVMPEMGGQALFHALRQQQPDVKVLLLTGHPLEEEDLETLRAQGLRGWLPKPPSLEQLAEVIAQVLGEE